MNKMRYDYLQMNDGWLQAALEDEVKKTELCE